MSIKDEVKAEQQRILNEKMEQRQVNEVKYKVDKKKLIIISMVIVGILVSIFVATRPDEYERARIKEDIRVKELVYNNYKNNTKYIINSNTIEDNISIMDISHTAIVHAKYRLDNNSDQTKKGNDKLNEVIKGATKTLNNSILIVLNSENLSYEDFKSIKSTIQDEVVNSYVNDENKELYDSIKDKYYYKEIADSLEESRKDQDYQNNQSRNILQSNLQTGMSESEVKKLAGLPNDTYKNDEAYFWVYDGVVLTMKKGYVYDITYELE
ncbi:hypothetical protein R6U77_12715 [Lysinibacillus louembei]|uniref:Lipoprotein n=1 Tax=Lysinibacillus louembei TaxID=1470088 RepID=A0ABZ0S0D5_9BACI|nr:hypothetical protein [Lysinibacillus louembei]WPK10742.1 hypothetical protein R6U77_12715 [Lysinibacillus louembei]